ncbi:MAG: fumarylacetoacetase [Burkholderiaceae bacterium]|nr:fumarylacetoacetase [Pseudomonadota bacterium]MBS0596946.1 fumarylacetoacetase [Pseudomonadota bacterium]MCO5115230.1 fumarylacetoacetase [Burkholderiaceae bacterium]MCP5219479.1 fumarylacetoacetase [Burkholderiaceae bacterium]
MPALNATHDPQRTSWVPSANDGNTDFPIQNLPHGIFRRQGSSENWRGGVAIGDQIVDMAAAVAAGVFTGAALAPARAAAQASLNDLMQMGPQSASILRQALSNALQAGSSQQAALQSCLVPQAQAEYTLPCRIGDYTDFYTSVHHATNIGRLFRPDNPLMPNYKWIPIGYHGRASSIGVSGQAFQRPRGQVKPPDADAPRLAPCARLDIELEMAVYVGPGNALGEPVALDEAESHIFGLALLNDWSARDIQAWEYQPLGPFLSKNFATTVSPWVVTMEALAPYRVPFTRPADDPQPLPYLASSGHSAAGGFDIQLEALIETRRMRQAQSAPVRLALTNYRHAYWSAAQMLTHHTVNGCNLQPGDLLGTGTLSGPTLDSACALIELTAGGKNPIHLPNGEVRTWVEDGDAIILRGWCEKPGAPRIGFGECVGTVLPAKQ